MMRFQTMALAAALVAVSALPVHAAATKTAVPAEKEQQVPAAASTLDINLASAAELAALPGVGAEAAKKIIENRPIFVKTQLLTKNIVSKDVFYDIVDKISIDLKKYDESILTAAKKRFNSELMANGKKAKMVKTKSGLKYRDVVIGTGAAVKKGKKVTAEYTGWLEDGSQFDTSVGKDPMTFVVGKKEVITGWEEGVATMRTGGVRRLFIPPALGYGASQVGPIPANSNLVFEIKILKVEDP